MAQLRAPVTAPPARPPRYGLIIAAPEWPGDGDLRELAGWAYQPEGCGLSGRLAVACEGQGNTAAMTEQPRPAVVEGVAVWLYAGDECTATGFAQRDWLGRARRQLAATESFELANELWTGSVAEGEAPDQPNRSLAGDAALSDTVTTAATTPELALASIECGLASYLQGQQGMVHVTPQVLTLLVAANAVVREGTTWVTAMGHIVVADAGYDGSGPGNVVAGATQWAYGTPMVQVRLGPVMTLPDTMDDARGIAQAMNRGVNDVVVWAGRLGAYRWASHCAHVAAEVDVPVCAVGGVA